MDVSQDSFDDKSIDERTPVQTKNKNKTIIKNVNIS